MYMYTFLCIWYKSCTCTCSCGSVCTVHVYIHTASRAHRKECPFYVLLTTIFLLHNHVVLGMAVSVCCAGRVPGRGLEHSGGGGGGSSNSFGYLLEQELGFDEDYSLSSHLPRMPHYHNSLGHGRDPPPLTK